jgi:hypothetical protein
LEQNFSPVICSHETGQFSHGGFFIVKTNRFFSFPLLVALSLISLQSAHAAITIKVSDTSGAPVSLALATITNVSDTTRVHRATTDRSGLCTIDLTSAAVQENVPQPFDLGQNFPNPFNPSTVIPFSLSHDGEVKLAIYNALGQNVRTLVNGRLSAGQHTAVWNGMDDDGRGVGAGVYISVLSFGKEQLAKKMLLMDGQNGNAVARGSSRNTVLLKPVAETYNIRIAGLDIETYETVGISLSDGSTYEYVVTRKTDINDIVIPGAGVPGTPVSDDRRQADFTNITQKLNAIKDLPDSVFNEQLARYLAVQPEIEVAGYGVGGAWGRFTDGRMIVFDVNVEAEDLSPAPGRSTPKSANASIATVSGRSAVSAASSWTDIPQSSNIGLYTGHDAATGWLSNIEHFVEDSTDENGNKIYSYTVGGGIKYASVDALINLPGNLAVFALNTHASDMAWNRLLEPVYAVYTSTPVTIGNEISYWSLLNSGQLVYYHPIIPKNLLDLFTYNDQLYHYAFTAAFVDNYWGKSKRFEGAKTFVYFNTCSALSLKGRPLADAVLRAGASLFAGWTYRSMNQDGPATASYIFDRLLGSNLFPPTMSDPHRPFSYDTLHDEMISLGYGKTLDDKYGKDKQGDAQYSWLLFVAAPNSPFKLLAPSIKYLVADEKIGIDEQAELTIYGTFGDTQGEVFIKKEGITASPLSIKEWGKDTIVCYLQDDDYGDVSVKVNGNRSNLRALSKWKGKINFTVIPNPTIPDQISCTVQDKVTWDLQLRADIAPYRESKPEGKPADRTIDFLPTKKSTTTFSSSGSQVINTDNGPVTLYSWSGNGQTRINDRRDTSISQIFYRFDTGTKIATMDLVFLGELGSKIIATNNGLVITRLQINTFFPTFLGLYDEVRVPYYYLKWPFDDSWSILPGQKSITVSQLFGVAGSANAPVTIKWDKMTVTNPPLDDQYHGK